MKNEGRKQINTLGSIYHKTRILMNIHKHTEEFKLQAERKDQVFNIKTRVL
ncbi:hypothetical protein HMPREF0645_0887 [Hallella bergensis DSM 17361]|uniref:Uncharacterized protein n=1 Tax=Hallella bergensis DSM 17361 TaxID=585502 RepID=D1PVA2_9BACT|nr:hypothetical protein HMPREF0645_0887 [Hallella bergensis DSM 17361]